MRSEIPKIGDKVEIFANGGVINKCYSEDVGVESEVVSMFLNKNGYLMLVLEQICGNCVCVMAHYVRAIDRRPGGAAAGGAK